MSIRVGIAGAKGRMGQALVRLIGDFPGLSLGAASLAPNEAGAGEPVGGGPEITYTARPEELFDNSTVIVDFTTPAATVNHAKMAAKTGKPLIIGTTGLSDKDHAEIRLAADAAPIFIAANFSLGVNLLAALTRLAAQRLGPSWDIEILEMHHRAKVDAPSGTALLLGGAAASGRGIDLSPHAVKSREGITGARQEGDIGFATVRGGTIAGDHTVIFAGDGERLELRHTAESRDIFARGALTAAQWVSDKPAGLYGPEQMLDLENIMNA